MIRSEMTKYARSGITAREIAKIKGYPLHAINGYSRRWKILLPRGERAISSKRIIAPSQEEKLRQMYIDEGKNCPEIARYFGTSQSVILNSLKRAGIPSRPTGKVRRYRLNENYFSRIDAEDKAYVLGLLHADGGMIERQGRVSTFYETCLQLHDDDRYLVEKVRDLWYPDGDKPVHKTRNQCRVTVSSRIFFKDLGRLGCIPRKSLVLKFPKESQVPHNLMFHYLRGYFDGDGCIQHSLVRGKNANGSVSFVGSKDFILPLKRFLRRYIDTAITVGAHSHSPQCYYLMFSAAHSIAVFYDLLYQGASIWMTRKRDRFINYFEDKANTYLSRAIEYVPKGFLTVNVNPV